METYDLQEGESFKRLPEISQIEVCSACNLQCPMCLRTTHLGRKAGLVDMKMLQMMYERGDFGGSHYIELQMAGEPTLHPQLSEIIRFLKYTVGVMVGLSTHGLEIQGRKGVLNALMDLDALTISVDSTDPETYHKMRFPAHIAQLYANLDVFFLQCESNLNLGFTIPMIELQLVKTKLAEKSGDVESLRKVMQEKGWDKYAKIRTIYDCFEGMQDRVSPKDIPNKGLCLNPFTSVSVTHNGDVVSCCLIFTPNKAEVNYYGNLNETSLAEIWNSEPLEKMRNQQLNYAANDGQRSGQCEKCTVTSPYLIHSQIVTSIIAAQRKE